MIAKNNIYNIRYNGQRWLGAVGSRKGFVVFETEVYAIRAWAVIMRTYARVHSVDTIESIVQRFAPQSENDTEGYIRFICDATSLPRDKHLWCFDYPLLGVAMARFETNSRLSYQGVLDVMVAFNVWPK